MEAVAKYDFKATADDELSFKRGEILKVNYFSLFSFSLNGVCIYVRPQSSFFRVFHSSLHVSMYVDCRSWVTTFTFEMKALESKAGFHLLLEFDFKACDMLMQQKCRIL